MAASAQPPERPHGPASPSRNLAREATMADLTVESRRRPAELLLIEDNHGDALLTREAFRNAKIANRLSVARDGEEAMSMLGRQGHHADQPRPDLILLDLSLPRMDGREVLEAIKSDPGLRSIPVIMLTGSQADIDICKSYELRANGYIVKPVNFDRLQKVVNSIESFWLNLAVLPATPAFEQSRGL
jgi:chemotaxis family two-component system response regulator Rcp1